MSDRNGASSDYSGGEPLWRHFVMAGLIAALLIPVLFFPPFRLIEARLYDILSVIAPPLPAQPGAVIVAIDEPSIGEIGQRWPWPRDIHAKLVESLRAAGAKVIAFDIIFADPTTEEADTALAKVLGPDVVLAADDVTTPLEQGTQVTRVNPLDAFLDAGAVAGVASMHLDGDAYLRRMPPISDCFRCRSAAAEGRTASRRSRWRADPVFRTSPLLSDLVLLPGPGSEEFSSARTISRTRSCWSA